MSDLTTFRKHIREKQDDFIHWCEESGLKANLIRPAQITKKQNRKRYLLDEKLSSYYRKHGVSKKRIQASNVEEIIKEAKKDALRYATKHDEADLVRALLARNFPVNAADKDGGTALLYGRSIETVEALVEAGANVNVRTLSGDTPLIAATRDGQEDIARFLLENGADVTARAPDGDTALLYIARVYPPCEGIVRDILTKGASVDESNNLGNTALMYAANADNAEVAEVLIEAKANVNAKNKKGENALLFAARAGNVVMANYLIKEGADIAVINHFLDSSDDTLENDKIKKTIQEATQTSWGATIRAAGSAVTGAASAIAGDVYSKLTPFGSSKTGVGGGAETPPPTQEQLRQISMGTPPVELVKKGVPSSAREIETDLTSKGSLKKRIQASRVEEGIKESGENALRHATINDDIDLVKVLLARNFPVNAADKDGRTALFYGRNIEIVKALLGAGANVNVRTLSGDTPLIDVARDGNEDVAKLLLENGANVNAAKENGATALMGAANNGHMGLAKILLDAKAEVNAANKYGETALMKAANSGNMNLIKILLDAKAEVNAANKHGETVLMMAANSGHMELAKTLLDAKADVNAANVHGDTALMRAANNGHMELAKFLIEAGAKISLYGDLTFKGAKALIEVGADVNARDSEGETPLHKNFSYGFAKALLEGGADVNARNSEGDTPLHGLSRFDWFYLENRILAKALLEGGADVNARNSKGKTPLHCLSRSDGTDAAKLLIEAGADVNARDSEGKTAEILENPELRNFLRVKALKDTLGTVGSGIKGVASTAGSAVAGAASAAAGYVYSKFRSPGNVSGGVAAVETPPPTYEQLRQMGVTTEAELATRQQKIAPPVVPRPSSSSHAPKGDPPKGAYDEETGASAIDVASAVNTAIPVVGAALRYFGTGLTPTQKVAKDVSGALSTSKAGTYRLDTEYERATPQKKAGAKAYKAIMMEKVDAVKESINETCFLFHDRYDERVEKLNALPEPHNDAEREAKEALRAECDAAKQMRDDAAELTITLGELHSAVEKRKMLSPENREFLEQQLKILEEATRPIEAVAQPLKQEGQSPRQRSHAKQQRQPRQRERKAGRGTV